MTYKQNKIEAAWVLAEHVLARYRYPAGEGFQLFLFRRAAAPIARYQAEERKKLVEKYHPEKMENGLLKFQDEDECAAFCAERDETEGLEAEMDMCPFRLRIPEGLELMQGDYEVLDGMIDLYLPEVPKKAEPAEKPADDDIQVSDIRILPNAE